MTRMWLCNPAILCRKHLLGEHNEHHKVYGSFRLKRSITGYIENNCLEPMSLEVRHNELAEEMVNRGYNHQSPLVQPDISYLPQHEREYKVDKEASLQDLLARCPECKANYDVLKKQVKGVGKQ
jgi:hypothetical protein